MNVQYDHLVHSSFKLFVENLLLKNGAAYTNTSGYFWPVQNVWNGYFTYATPYQPIIADRSIAGATIMSGIYLSGNFITTGQSGLVDINYEKGELYFNTQVANPQTSLSGNYSVADFSVKLTNAPEEELLFETKYVLKSKVQDSVSGLPPNFSTYPVVFLKLNGGGNEPWAFGGTDQSVHKFLVLILANSQYLANGASSIIKDRARSVMPRVTGASDLPYNSLGGLSNGTYNYSATFTGRFSQTNSLWMERADTTELSRGLRTQVLTLNPAAFLDIVECEIHSYRNPRV